MPKRSLSQVLASRLREVMDEKGISANVLGSKAHISPRSVGNCLAPSQTTSRGKERSHTLGTVDALAKALNVPPLALLMDEEQRADLAMFLVNELAGRKVSNGHRNGPAPPDPEHGPRVR